VAVVAEFQVLLILAHAQAATVATVLVLTAPFTQVEQGQQAHLPMAAAVAGRE
jgi:hypothetical protein